MNDIDQRLDYGALFERYCQHIRKAGTQWTCLCPVTPEKNNSFSIDTKTGRCQCYSCGWTGNFFSLRAELEGISSGEAYKRTLEEAGIPLDKPAGTDKAAPEPVALPYSLDDYATEKRLPAGWLKGVLGLSDGKGKRGGWVNIPYYGPDGSVVATRRRNNPKADPRFTWVRGSKVTLYGLQFLDAIREDGRVILCEGESDAQTLIYLGFNALGVPGASTMQAAHAETLADLSSIYVHQEPDAGGALFFERVAARLKDAGFTGTLYRFTCNAAGVKDPSALYLKYGPDAQERLQALLDGAERVDLNAEPETIPGAPVNLRIPYPYQADDAGIWRVDPAGKKGPELVVRTPVTIARRLVAHDSAEEKIEVLFKRDGRFLGGIFPRADIFSKTGILELTAMGATISSDNAAAVVKYLSALEAENIERLPVSKTSQTLGWLPGGQFLPWHADGTVLDAHASLASWAGACVKRGTLDGWRSIMGGFREASNRFRFIMAGAFAAPLLRIVKCRSFLIYCWADSRGGKTATLKAALSVWGDPEKMMVTFNSTRVALERMASFFCDIPLGIDERQLAGNSQESLETMFYMLSNGVSRGRGTRDGGVQAVSTWRTVALTTGEEPVQQDTTMSGVATRTLEVVGAPFDSEPDAAYMHRHAGEHTGVAGDAFMSYVLQTGDAAVVARYNAMLADVEAVAGDRNSSHVASLAAVATADAIASEVIFSDTPEAARKKALDMVSEIVAGMRAEELPDVNVSACAYVLDWLTSNADRAFTADALTRFGWIDQTGGVTVFETIPSALRKALTDGGFSYRKSLKYLQDRGAILTAQKGGRPSTVLKKSGYNVRLIRIDAAALALLAGGDSKPQTKTPAPVDDEMPF